MTLSDGNLGFPFKWTVFPDLCQVPHPFYGVALVGKLHLETQVKAVGGKEKEKQMLRKEKFWLNHPSPEAFWFPSSP